MREFFGVRAAAQQPIPFPHKTHIEEGDAQVHGDCHESVEKGPVAGIPSVKTCMICHEPIATDRPLIKQITTTTTEKGIDMPWQRVYGFTPRSARALQPRAAHPRQASTARPATATSRKQTVAERNVDHTMGFCVNCHREKKASNDCLTCHF